MSNQRNEKYARQEILRKAKLLDELGIRGPESFRQDQVQLMGFLDVAGTYATMLQSSNTEGNLREATNQVMRNLDNVLNSQPARVVLDDSDHSVSLACKSGCNYCCKIRVTAFAPQILSIAKFLRTNLAEPALTQLTERLETYVREGEGNSPLESVNRSTLCPLNIAGMCSIYAVRPLGCMRHHSFSLPKCLEADEKSDADIRIPQDGKRWSIASVYSAAIEYTLKAKNLSSDVLEFIPALLIALKDETAGSKYINGEDVFASAHRPDILEAEASEFAKREGLQRLPMSAS